jgi:hypothetical protein
MKQAIRSLFASFTPFGKFWLFLGLVSLAAAAGMSFMVGMKMTVLHALFLAVLSFVTAFLPDAAYRAWGEGKRGVSVILAILAMPLFVVEFGQHAAYTAGIRGNELAVTKVQNIKYDDGRGDVEDAKRTLVMFEKRLADLQGENKWATTVTADALRAKMESLNLAIKLEAERRGCKSKCLERTKERDEIASRIALLERVDETTKKIEATKAVIANARVKSATIEHKSSQTEHMNAFLSKAASFVGKGELTPDAYTEEGTQLSANLAIALAGTGLPALALFIAGLYRREETQEEVVARETVSRPAPINLAKTPTVQPGHSVTVNLAKEDDIWKVIQQAMQRPA